MGAERDILEVKISNKTFEQKGAKKTFHIYNNSYLQTIEMGWWSKLESAHGLVEGVDGWESSSIVSKPCLKKILAGGGFPGNHKKNLDTPLVTIMQLVF